MNESLNHKPVLDEIEESIRLLEKRGTDAALSAMSSSLYELVIKINRDYWVPDVLRAILDVARKEKWTDPSQFLTEKINAYLEELFAKGEIKKLTADNTTFMVKRFRPE